MSSKRYNKLPEKTSELPAEQMEKLLPLIKNNCTTKSSIKVKLEWHIRELQTSKWEGY